VTWATLRESLARITGRGVAPLQRLGLLAEILPEFTRIDSLVVRDFYHRYTWNEHTCAPSSICRN